MSRPIDIDAEMAALEARKDRLRKLLALRMEVTGLEKQILSGSDGNLRMKIIIEEVCAVFGLSFDRMLSRSRMQEIAYPRQVVFYLARVLADDLSLSKIGATFHRDHGTVLYGIHSVRERLDTDPLLRRRIEEITIKCHGRFAEITNEHEG